MCEQMYKYIPTKISEDAFKYFFKDPNNHAISFHDFISLLKNEDEHFLATFRDSLNHATAEFSAYFWECVPVSSETIHRTFEFVAVKSRILNYIKQDFADFKEHIFKSRDEYACSFPNLGKDAMLIVPIPQEGDCNEIRDYKHISSFSMNAPIEQQQKFWKEVANRLFESLDKKSPRWLSTNGLGVHYLHVRIDKSPKYYDFLDYRIHKITNIGKI
ncbi:1647_t:CDS:1 [Acaulospora morrowiae]|uniref:1647_t:CDS:1 n=1 Tax=Acaulospora morrowiae TaxID=94023 RepID=A0A9N8WPY7_9GLOM|nr:1647_t:CDS:1 [Acaulospora morrowiae]